MRVRPRLVAASGSALLLALAVVIVVAPWLLGPLHSPVRRLLRLGVTNGTLALLAVGTAALVGGILVGRRPPNTEMTRTDIERLVGGVTSNTAGADLDARLEELHSADATTRAELADELRDDLRKTAVTVLMRTEGWTASDARIHLDHGTWTTDPQAAAFFAETPPSLSVRLREWLRREPGTVQRLARVIDDLDARLVSASEADSPERETSSARRTVTGREHSGPDERTDPHRHEVPDAPAGTDSAVTETVRVVPDTETGPSVLVAPRTFGVAVGLVAVALGVATETATPFLLGVLAVGYPGFTYLADAPRPTVAMTRTVGADDPVPGDLVDVAVTVENVGARSLTDLRVVDGPPDALRVVEGSPALQTSLQPGGTDTFSYTVQVKRGEFTFAETTLITRSPSGARERSASVEIPTRVTASTLLEDVPLKAQNSRRIGTVKTDQSGSGIEFYATREYRRGDPLSRIDWNHLAKTGTLTTVQFREQRAPTVAILLDQRDAARVAPRGAALDGVDLGVYAAERAFLTLLEANTEVGLVTYSAQLSALDPASDAAHRARVQAELRRATDRYAAALGEATVDSSGGVRRQSAPSVEALTEHIPRNGQVLVLSPATDDFAVEVTERLRAVGHPVTLLSPAVVGTGSLGARRQRLDRTCRLRAIRESGIHVVDWQPEEALQLALARALTRTEP